MRIRILVASAIIAMSAFAQVPAPDFDVTLFLPALSPNGLAVEMTTTGPPLTPFTVYYLIGDFTTTRIENMPFGALYSGQTGANGTHTAVLPIQTPPGQGFTVPEFRMAAVFTPPAAPIVVTEIVALSLTGNPPANPPPPCNTRIASMALEHNPCITTLEAKVCPGDVVELKKNGVVIGTGVAGASGVVVISQGGCVTAADIMTATVNGQPLAGPIHGP